MLYEVITHSLQILFAFTLIFLASGAIVWAESPTDLYKQGLTYTDQGDYEDALKMFVQAIELSPNSTQLWLSKGSTLSSLGRYQEAIEAFDNVTRIEITNKDVWYPRGVA